MGCGGDYLEKGAPWRGARLVSPFLRRQKQSDAHNSNSGDASFDASARLGDFITGRATRITEAHIT